MSLWLHRLGAEVHGLALPPETDQGVYSRSCCGVFASEAMVDIRDAAATEKAVLQARPEMVFHLAAQPLVRLAYRQPLETLACNVMGTAHVMNALRSLPEAPRMAVIVSSDKCYENVGWHHGYRENDPMGGYDPYSASKGGTEIIAAAWRRSYLNETTCVATARGGNVIGGGDWAEDRIVPDCIRALKVGKAIELRNPGATRPWQHVLDCLSGYLALGARLWHEQPGSPVCSGFNFGPSLASAKTVRSLVGEVLNHWPGEWHDLSGGKSPHEAQFLQLAIEKASTVLGWAPVWDFRTTVQHTIEWYRVQYDGRTDLRGFTELQIARYEADASSQEAAWATSTS
jgi:CDP-glucose 4,6-dehydratase